MTVAEAAILSLFSYICKKALKKDKSSFCYILWECYHIHYYFFIYLLKSGIILTLNNKSMEYYHYYINYIINYIGFRVINKELDSKFGKW